MKKREKENMYKIEHSNHSNSKQNTNRNGYVYLYRSSGQYLNTRTIYVVCSAFEKYIFWKISHLYILYYGPRSVHEETRHGYRETEWTSDRENTTQSKRGEWKRETFF